MAFKSYRDGSKTNFGSATGDTGMTLEQINAGSLMRIADATEKMAHRHTELIEQRDRFERWYKNELERVEHLRRSNAALRGHLKRLKKQLSNRSN